MRNLKNLQFEDHSGLKLTKLSTGLSYSKEKISLKRLKIGLNQTYLYADYFEMLTPNGAEDYKDFVNGNLKIYLLRTLEKLHLNLKLILNMLKRNHF